MKKFWLVILVIAVIAGVYSFSKAPKTDPQTLRHLASGDVIGFADKDNAYSWMSIPFAQPPIGELRWRAPQAVKPWTGVRKALKAKPMCSQVFPFNWPKRVITLGGEDCLYLDVSTPALSPEQLKSSHLPVMVWIHGGANTVGSSSATSAHRLAGKENVVVVSLRYRLGLFGWFSHPALRDTANSELDSTANFAVLDMIEALKWVQTNAAAFGGNPDNVTIFGQSAGGFNVMALLASPKAKGLFHRAISESGNIQTVPRSRAENYSDDAEPGLAFSSREFINKLLIADGRADNRAEARAMQDSMAADELADYLRGKTVKELFAVVKRRSGLGYFTPTNIRDGIVLPNKPLLEVFKNPADYNRVPLILGNNRDEYKFFLWAGDRFSEKRFGILPKLKDVDDYNHFTRYFSDQWQAIAVDEPAAVLSKSQPGKVFAYRFDWADQKPILGVDMAELIGAGHGIEVTFLYGQDAVQGLSNFAHSKSAESRDYVSDAMMSYWAQFARTGKPGRGGSVQWPEWVAWQPDVPGKMVFNSEEHGGVRMVKTGVTVADLKQRLKNDEKLRSVRERCELYAQLFRYALTTDFWSDSEYHALGCDGFPVENFSGVR